MLGAGPAPDSVAIPKQVQLRWHLPPLYPHSFIASHLMFNDKILGFGFDQDGD